MADNQTKTSPDTLIAFQGSPGAHSDLACRRAHPYMETLACPTFEDVFDAVENGNAKLGMIPVENSQAGRVAEIHNLFPESNLHFIGEYFHKVEHHLMAPEGASVDTIASVYSHPQALMQCSAHLRALGINDRHTHSDTAASAADVAEWGDKSKAALASSLAADLYGLDIIKANMEDSHDNTTQFITISRDPDDPDEGADHVLTTLLFMVRNIPSALFKAMGGFATNNINVVKLESYIPTPARTEAQFFITFEGNPRQRNVQLALEELGFFCKKVKVLGVYLADPLRYEGRDSSI